MREVLQAIRSILDYGKMPASVPHEYRRALVELLFARVDRSSERQQHGHHAMRALNRVLEAAATDSELFSLKRLLQIDSKVANFETTLSTVPRLPQPDPTLTAKFQYKHVAKGGETIADVALAYGFGPKNLYAMAYSPYNYDLHMTLVKGDTIYVPLPPARLQALIERLEALATVARTSLTVALDEAEANREIEEQVEDLENALVVIEAASVCFNVLHALGEGIVIGAKAAKLGTRAAEAGFESFKVTLLKGGELKIAEANAHELHHLIHSHLLEWAAISVGHTALEFLGWGLEASKGLKAWGARHHASVVLHHNPINWLSPTYWAPLFAAGWSLATFGVRRLTGSQAAPAAKRDAKELLRIFLYGVDEHSERLKEGHKAELERRAEAEIENLEWAKMQAEAQMKSPMYQYQP